MIFHDTHECDGSFSIPSELFTVKDNTQTEINWFFFVMAMQYIPDWIDKKWPKMRVIPNINEKKNTTLNTKNLLWKLLKIIGEEYIYK